MGGGEGAAGPGAGPTRLLEREREFEVLDRAIAGTLTGQAGLVLVEGPAGIGKSRLVAEARKRAAESSLFVLSARRGELERDFPFGVVRQLYEPCLADEGVRRRVLEGAARAAANVFGLPRELVEDDRSGDGASPRSTASTG
jgi:AAA ATPase domain